MCNQCAPCARLPCCGRRATRTWCCSCRPPRLAIVTSFCKGQTLYTMIHLNKNTFKINKAIIIASQVSQVRALCMQHAADRSIGDSGKPVGAVVSA